MAIEPIKDDADHRRALERIEAIWNAPEGAPEFFELDALATLVERYEERRWPIKAATPLEALRFAMEQRGYNQKDLAALLRSRSRASEIMTGNRALTLNQIRMISKYWRVPAAVLIDEPEREVA
jgi:HTH-type transcriptional regulator/antitoxin HigA